MDTLVRVCVCGGMQRAALACYSSSSSFSSHSACSRPHFVAWQILLLLHFPFFSLQLQGLLCSPFLSASRSATLFPSVSCYLFLAVFARLEIIIIIIIKRQNQRTAEPTTFAFFSLHSFCTHTHTQTHTQTHLYTRVFNFETNTFFFVSHSRWLAALSPFPLCSLVSHSLWWPSLSLSRSGNSCAFPPFAVTSSPSSWPSSSFAEAFMQFFRSIPLGYLSTVAALAFYAASSSLCPHTHSRPLSLSLSLTLLALLSFSCVCVKFVVVAFILARITFDCI